MVLTHDDAFQLVVGETSGYVRGMGFGPLPQRHGYHTREKLHREMENIRSERDELRKEFDVLTKECNEVMKEWIKLGRSVTKQLRNWLEWRLIKMRSVHRWPCCSKHSKK